MEISDLTTGEEFMSPVAKNIADTVYSTTIYVTMADKDKEIFYYDNDAEIWRENGESLIWKIVASKHPMLKKEQLNNIIHYVKGMTLIQRESFHPPEGWVTFHNETRDAKHNYSIVDAKPNHYIRNRFPIRLNRKAVCPEFSKFLNQVLPDVEDRMTLLEAMAQILVPHFNFEKAVMFIGTTSANGKSTIMKVMKKLFGADNIVAISLQDLIYNRFMGQKLDGKLLNMYADINDKKISDLDKFKLFTSGDNVTVERKNGHPYEMEPIAKHFFSTNTLPEIDEDNAAVYRRFLMIEFPISFEHNKDLDLFDRITTISELEGIMFLLFRIARRLSRNRKFTYEQTPDEIRMRWKLESNATYELIEHSGLLRKVQSKRISRAEFYTAYVKFCKEKHYTIKSSSTVTRQVQKLGYESQKSNGVWYWLGLYPNISSEGQNIL